MKNRANRCVDIYKEQNTHFLVETRTSEISCSYMLNTIKKLRFSYGYSLLSTKESHTRVQRPSPNRPGTRRRIAEQMGFFSSSLHYLKAKCPGGCTHPVEISEESAGHPAAPGCSPCYSLARPFLKTTLTISLTC